MNTSQEFYKRAKDLIPGGTQLLSKRPEMYLPDQWPSYYQKAKGVNIWDMEDNKYTDMSIMGIGACILGYSDDDVNKAVKGAVDAGSMATLNCPEEVELAELLIKLNPWASMVRYTRTGGEAMAVAVRIARTRSGKDRIAFCGYHGWHDWYLSANLADDANLDGQLLPGLDPAGVPRGLIGSSVPFNYNRIDELENIIEKHDDIGVITMEVIRHHEPDKHFLENVRKIADEIDAVLIFDEVSSGWRLTVGGAHALYNVEPDIAVYGKAMSNGYPMAAIVGKRDVMDAAQNTFISSTYWTERIGPVASIATINKLQENNVPSHICKIGDMIRANWEKLAQENDLIIHTEGMSPLPTFILDYEERQALHTLFTQEMLGRGYLASKSVYVSYSHKEHIVEKYMENVNDVFSVLRKAIEQNNVNDLLKGPVSHVGFKRLT